jgi:hypothetical protein
VFWNSICEKSVNVKANEGRYNAINTLQTRFNGNTFQIKDICVDVTTTDMDLKKYDGVQWTGLEWINWLKTEKSAHLL